MRPSHPVRHFWPFRNQRFFCSRLRARFLVARLGMQTACQKRLSVGFYIAAALVHELLEARDEKRLLRLQRQLAGYKLLIIDELGYVPLSQTGAELLFEVFSQRYERGSTIVTSNLPFDEWTSVFGSERLTGALLDRLTHHVHILEMNGESYRLNQSKHRSRRASSDTPADNPIQA
jgi:DNA replication protein DnaC